MSRKRWRRKGKHLHADRHQRLNFFGLVVGAILLGLLIPATLAYWPVIKSSPSKLQAAINYPSFRLRMEKQITIRIGKPEGPNLIFRLGPFNLGWGGSRGGRAFPTVYAAETSKWPYTANAGNPGQLRYVGHPLLPQETIDSLNNKAAIIHAAAVANDIPEMALFYLFKQEAPRSPDDWQGYLKYNPPSTEGLVGAYSPNFLRTDRECYQGSKEIDDYCFRIQAFDAARYVQLKGNYGLSSEDDPLADRVVKAVWYYNGTGHGSPEKSPYVSAYAESTPANFSYVNEAGQTLYHWEYWPHYSCNQCAPVNTKIKWIGYKGFVRLTK